MRSLESLLKDAISKFNEKVKIDDRLKEALKGITRKIVVELEQGKKFSFIIQNCEITNFSVGGLEQADVQIISDSETLEKLLTKELSPFKAYALGKLKIKAPLADLMALRKFLKGE
ncbi:MAG: SCP2 sterol-binding domain-containing protein [Candidatus Thermoplasmatota archaeon]